MKIEKPISLSRVLPNVRMTNRDLRDIKKAAAVLEITAHELLRQLIGHYLKSSWKLQDRDVQTLSAIFPQMRCTEEQYIRVHDAANHNNVSVGEIIRQLITQYLKEPASENKK